jgi:hypothetical protein
MIPTKQVSIEAFHPFHSLKSDLQNFNETTELHQQLNPLKEVNAHLVGQYRPSAEPVYNYTYLNRYFDYLLMNLIHQLEKDHNNGQRLNAENRQEWRQTFPYLTTNWESCDHRLKNYTLDLVNELNRRLKVEVPLIGFRKQEIRYHWLNTEQTAVVFLIKVYKKYVYPDVVYHDRWNPNFKEIIDSDFEREVLIYVDQIDLQNGRYHWKYLRLPSIDYTNEGDLLDDLTYAGAIDRWFYLARSKDPAYRIITNTEARDVYLKTLQKSQKTATCFSPVSKGSLLDQTRQIRDRTDCEMTQGLWVEKCQKDADCPYYQSNKNYPNEQGGCDRSTGYCQMPVGVTPLTYLTPSNPQNAYCYNCKNGVGQCCGEQKRPDYMFENDQTQRYSSRQILEQDGLNWSKYS